MHAGPRLGAVLLIGTAGLSFATALLAQQHLRQHRQPLGHATTASDLWTTYRFAIDPALRREAALMMVATTEGDTFRHSQLLDGQGWGSDPLAAVALELAAETAEERGDNATADALWNDLHRRFPSNASSAWALARLSETRPQLFDQLLSAHPSHPAALAAAEARDPGEGQTGHQGAVHLARWGASWPGAAGRLRDACADQSATGPSDEQRQWLAQGLTKIGDGVGALRCLNETVAEPATALAIGRTLLLSGGAQDKQGQRMLLTLTQEHPNAPESLEAAELLSDPLLPDPAVLDGIPATLADQSAAVAAARVRLAGGKGADRVIERWPDQPSSWQLQWDLARDALLEGNWDTARRLLALLPATTLPQPLNARRLFWLGFSEQRLNRQDDAFSHWRRLVEEHPAGYYRWRAKVRLGEANTPDLNLLDGTDPTLATPPWTPLNSRNPMVNTLWRLGLTDEAWDHWRSGNDPAAQRSPAEQLVEGRLRLAIDDPWTALGRLWRLSLRWRTPSCDQQIQLQRAQSPIFFRDAFLASASSQRLRPELLLGLTKQESRFSPTVSSVVGARGLMQLMPATADEVAGRMLEPNELNDPAFNIELGATYLRQMLNTWQNNPLLAIASYNAGPGAVNGWLTDELNHSPELWVERIPYPETRYYTKKVMDNVLRYSAEHPDRCEQPGSRDQMADPDSTEQDG